MNEQEDKDAFERGQVQPQCPGCGQSVLILGKSVKMVEKNTENYILARAYQCAQCQERFVAYIGRPIDAQG